MSHKSTELQSCIIIIVSQQILYFLYRKKFVPTLIHLVITLSVDTDGVVVCQNGHRLLSADDLCFLLCDTLYIVTIPHHPYNITEVALKQRLGVYKFCDVYKRYQQIHYYNKK